MKAQNRKAKGVLHVRLFGELRVAAQDRPLRLMRGARKTHALFAFLVLHRGQISSRADIAFRLWPDCGESEARANLRRHMYELQRCLPESSLQFETDSRMLRIHADSAITVDVEAFWAAIALGAHEEAVALYSGELLQCSGEEWLAPIRERTFRAYLNALSQCVNEHWKNGDSSRAAAMAEKLLAADPWREDAVRAMMQMREQLGDHAGALETYRAFAERLLDEFGAVPSGETQALYARLQGNEGLQSPQLSLFVPEHITWVHAFPWWWVSQLRNAPAALAVVAYLRTLEAGGSNAFDLPPRGYEAVGMTNAAFEDALKTLLQGGIIDAMRGSLRRRFTFVFEEPRANRERRNETRPRRTSTA